MRSHSLGGTRPANTSASVPRLMPLYSALITTSPSAGGRSASPRISPRPGAVTQNARASSGISAHSDAPVAPLQCRPRVRARVHGGPWLDRRLVDRRRCGISAGGRSVLRRTVHGRRSGRRRPPSPRAIRACQSRHDDSRDAGGDRSGARWASCLGAGVLVGDWSDGADGSARRPRRLARALHAHGQRVRRAL